MMPYYGSSSSSYPPNAIPPLQASSSSSARGVSGGGGHAVGPSSSTGLHNSEVFLTSSTKAIKLSLYDVTSRPGESRCSLCNEYSSTAKEGILMYHVLGKKDHVKSRHAMCKRFEDWGEDRYWEEVFNRIRAYLLGKPGADGLMTRIIESYPQLSFSARMIYQGRWWETLDLNNPMLKWWLDRQLSDFRRSCIEVTHMNSTSLGSHSSRVDPRSDSEALDLGGKKFAEMAQLFYGEQPCPVRFHVNNYARGLLIIGIGPESVTQLELNCSSAQRPGNVLRLWMNWILRELLALFVLHFIESGTQGYPTPYEWARSYVKEHLTYLCSLNQPHVRHITTDYCRWTVWCINNLYDSGRRPMIFRSLQSMFRAFEDAYFMSDTSLAMIPTPTQDQKDRFEFLDIIVATMAQELNIQRRAKP